jgi:hypothetical protein
MGKALRRRAFGFYYKLLSSLDERRTVISEPCKGVDVALLSARPGDVGFSTGSCPMGEFA